MGVVIPQVVTEDRASGAQVIDGSLRFDASVTDLRRTPSGAGNRKTFTWAGWVKKNKGGDYQRFVATVVPSVSQEYIRFDNDDVSVVDYVYHVMSFVTISSIAMKFGINT